MPPRARRLIQLKKPPNEQPKTMMNPINAARATLQVAGLPNEDVAEIVYEPLEAAGVSITGRAFNAWDRDAVLERVVSASGNGDVSAADAAGGELHALPLAAVGLSTVQVGCTAGAVSVAAFDATPAAAAKPVLLAAVASMLADALREVGLNEVEPVVFLRVPASSNAAPAAATAVCDAAVSFGLVVIDHADSGVIALARSEAAATLDAAFKFEPASPKVPGAGLDIVAVPRIVVPPTYAEAAAGVTAAPPKPAPALPVYRSLRFLAIFVVACMLIGMWTYAYPADAGTSQLATTTTTSTAKTPLLELLRHPAARGRTLQSVGGSGSGSGSGSDFDDDGAPDGTYIVDLASMTKILHEIVQDRRASGSGSGSGRDDDDYTVGWATWFWATHSISS